MSELLRILNKYIVLLIIWSIVGMTWFYIQPFIMRKALESTTDLALSFSNVNALPTYIDYLIRVIIAICIVIDFKKHKLNFVLLTCVASLFYPLLGMVILALLFIEKRKENARE